MRDEKDFREVAHSGGRATFEIECDEEGNRSYAQGFEHSRIGPAAIVGIYVLVPQGIPVADFRMGGIGQSFDPPPPEGCMPVFLGSDSEACWGHQCQRCKGYFRNRSHPAIYPLTCPYCGLRAASHAFLTPAQREYVRHYVTTLLDGLDADMAPGTSRTLEIDMDAIADQTADVPKPSFYYTAESQQTRYVCSHCGEFNDIRGKYGYCAACGWRNNLVSLKAAIERLREKINSREIASEEATKSIVSEFDACCRDVVTQLRKRVPMKESRRSDLQRLIFHDIESKAVSLLKSMFDIDLLRGLAADRSFINMMMHRRHIFEHNSGVVDERYVQESGDSEARLGVLVRETQENAHRLMGSLARMVENLDKDFHEIFVPTEWPIKHHQRRRTSG